MCAVFASRPSVKMRLAETDAGKAGGSGGGRGGEIGIHVLVSDEEGLRIPGADRRTLFVIDDLGDDEIRIGDGADRETPGGNGGEAGLLEVREPIIGSGFERGGFDNARGSEIGGAEAEIIARVEGSIADEEDGLRFAAPVRNSVLEESANGEGATFAEIVFVEKLVRGDQLARDGPGIRGGEPGERGWRRSRDERS